MTVTNFVGSDPFCLQTATKVALAMLRYHACACVYATVHTVLMYTSSKYARAKEVYRTWRRYGVLTLVKQTGVWSLGTVQIALNLYAQSISL